MEEGKELPIDEDPRTRRVKPGEFIPFKDEEGNIWLRHCGECTRPTKRIMKKYPGAEFAESYCEECEKELFEQLEEADRKNG
jgi:hypothetical protein